MASFADMIPFILAGGEAVNREDWAEVRVKRDPDDRVRFRDQNGQQVELQALDLLSTQWRKCLPSRLSFAGAIDHAGRGYTLTRAGDRTVYVRLSDDGRHIKVHDANGVARDLGADDVTATDWEVIDG